MTASLLISVVAFALSASGTGFVLHSGASTAVKAQHRAQAKVSHLVNAPTTAEGHHELAEYFRKEAEQERARAQHYSEVSVTYRLHPPRVDAVRNVSTADYYQRLAEEARNEALADDEMATFHDRLAEGIVPAK